MNKIIIYFRKSIAPTIVATIIFFVTYYFFGMENTMIGPFATLSFLRYRSMCNRYELMVKNFIYYGTIAILAFFATINLPLCIIVNMAVLLWIGGILIDEYNPTNYFPMGMALIFFQIAPAKSPTALMTRLLALAVTFVIIICFVLILDRKHDRSALVRQLVEEGFSISQKLVSDEKANPAEKNALHIRLCDINSRLSHEIYAFNRASILHHESINWYCKFIIIFQIINYLTQAGNDEADKKRAQKGFDRYYKLFKEEKPSKHYRVLNFRVKAFDHRNFRLRFALRQALVIGPCMVFAYISQLPNIYWLPISVFFMMIPFSDQTIQRIKQRLSGTIGGICICLILFTLFDSFVSRVIIMTLANFMIYGANGYGMTVAYITCSALSLQTMNSVVINALGYRLLYTLLGALIALLANKLVFPVGASKQISYLIGLLDDIICKLAELDYREDLTISQKAKQSDQYIVKSYLITERIKVLLNQGQDIPLDIEAIKKRHIYNMADIMTKYIF